MSDHQTFGDWLTVRAIWLACIAGSLTFWFGFVPWLVRAFR